MSGWVWVGLGIVVLAGLVMAACSRGAARGGEPFVDSRRDAQGNVMLRDTDRMWSDFTGSVDRDIERERSGGRPSGGTPSWNEHWRLRMNAYRSSQDNAPRYLDYIVQARRQAGLPELANPADAP